MSLKPTYVGAVVVAAATVASIAAAPLAAADGADNAIADLQAQGYTVQINWVHGFDTEPLSVCTVTGINNPNSGTGSAKGETVYVDVTCPNHDDEGGFGVGGGIGIG
jgi:hypothetical protein